MLSPRLLSLGIVVAWLGAGCATTPTPKEKTAKDFYVAGVEALRAKRNADGEAELLRCLALDPKHVGCRWELGWALFLELKWEAAVAEWKTVATLDPKYPLLAKTIAKGEAHLDARAQMLAIRPKPRKAKPVKAAAAKKKTPTTIRIRAVGDTMIGSDFPGAGSLPPSTDPSILTDVKALLEDADLTFANLEGTFCDGGTTEKCGESENCYAFRTPTRFAEQIKAAGIDVVSLANNHIEDFGDVCRTATEATMDQLGIAWSGRPGKVAHTKVGETDLAWIAFHTAKHCNDVNDLEAAAKLVRETVKAGSLVVVSFHGGAEGFEALRLPDGPEKFAGENRGDLRKFARKMVDAGASLVIGHGPHVPRAMEIYRKRLIAYSLGNFATYRKFNLMGFNGTGPLLEVELNRKGRFAAGRILALRQRDAGVPGPDADATATDLIRWLSAEDFPETGVAIDADGRIRPPRKSEVRERRKALAKRTTL